MLASFMLPRARRSSERRSPLSHAALVVGLAMACTVGASGDVRDRGARSGRPSGTFSRLWYPVPEDTLRAPVATRQVKSGQYQTLGLDIDALREFLKHAPREGTPDAGRNRLVLDIPWPDGGFKRFSIEESPIMEPELAEQFPELRTYAGSGVDDPEARLRFDWTISGFHAMVLSPEATVLIDPYSPDDSQGYIVYDAHDYTRRGAEPFRCSVGDDESPLEAAPSPRQPPNGATLRTYRLAVAATVEYTASQGGTIVGAMSTILTTVNRVNLIFERDLAVRLSLVGNNAAIIFTTTDSYTNGDALAMQCENPSVLDANIGVSNYDIGHVLATAGGGRAQVAVVCSAAPNCPAPTGSDKARGASGSTNPQGDIHDVQVVAHELGHQFGAQHTFNGTTGSCSGNRNQPTAFEPGGGSTIMSYAGACGAESFQLAPDDYFHAGSQDQMIAFITNGATGGSCGSPTATGNTPPTVNAGPDFTVPKATPFTLTATASDPNGDYLTYIWEEMDLGTASSAPPGGVIDDGTRPLFRSFPPGSSRSRTFPRISDVLTPPANWAGEVLPTTTRAMHFRVTARDNRIDGGGTASDEMVLNIRADSGPFSVTQPTGPVNWTAGSTQTVSWNVANSSAPPVSCANVRISLSLDGGNTFPIVLVASTPNDGSEAVAVPNNPAATARIKVEAVGNVFFNVSSSNFSISTPAAVLSIADVTVMEGDAGTTTANFTVTVTPASASVVTVAYATADGSAAAGSDYLATSGMLTFAPGEPSKRIAVTVNGDVVNEGDEVFFVNLSGASGATISDAQAVGNIANDECAVTTPGVTDGTFEAGTPWPAWTVQTSTQRGTPICRRGNVALPDCGSGIEPYAGNNVAMFGARSGAETATLGRTLAFPLSRSLTLRFQMQVRTITGTAVETLVVKVDGTPVATFTEGTTADSAYSLRYVDLSAFADGASHTLLFTHTNAAPTSNWAIFLVDNVELFSCAPSLAVNDVAVTEGNAGTSTALFTVTLSPKRPSTVTVAYATADGTATAGSDYVSTSGVLTFLPGETTKTVPVTVNGDTTAEATETFFLTLSGAANATITGSQGVGTIVSDDCSGGPPLLAGLADGTFEAGSPWPAWPVQTSTNYGTPLCNTTTCGTSSPPYAGTNWAWFGGAAALETTTLGQTVVLPASASLTLRFQMRISYVSAPPTDTFVVYVDGVPVRTYPEPIAADPAYALQQVDLTPFANGAPHALLFAYNGPTTGIGNYLVDNVDVIYCPLAAQPSITISDATISEGNSGVSKANFTVTLSSASTQAVSVTYATADGTAIAGSDYAPASGTLLFPPGATKLPVSVSVNGDALDEPDEGFLVNLSSPTNATIADGQGVGTIRNDDPTPRLAMSDVTVAERASGSTANFAVTLSAASGRQVTVAYKTVDGTAMAGADYTALSGTLTFAPGVTARGIAVPVAGDGLAEPNEVFFVNLGSPANATVGDGQGIGTITAAGTLKGDFNMDGQPDIVFRKVANTAQNKVWLMSGVARISEAAIVPDAVTPNWLVRGVDDFDNADSPGSGKDGKNDLVFWNQVVGAVEFWLMNGTSRVGPAVALSGPVLPSNWDLSATADFNHDGKPDIVWRDFSTQKLVIWTMNRTTKAGEIVPNPDQAVNGNWIVVAAADYNNDDNTDFLWYNYSSGKIVTWYMDAVVVRTAGQFTVPDAAGNNNWKVVASSDYSGGSGPGTPPLGSPDILWRNETSGNQVVWHMDFNSTRVHGEFTSPTANSPALDWVIAGPR